MFRINIFQSLTLGLIVLFCLVCSVNAAANGHFSFSPVQVRATMVGITNSAAYFRITNSGGTADRLLGAKMAAASRVEIHSMEIDDGVMRMRHIDDGLSIAAGESLNLVPGGLHIMLMGLTTHLAAESQYDITLIFEKAGEITVSATAKRPEDIMIKRSSHEGHKGHDMSKHSQ